MFTLISGRRPVTGRDCGGGNRGRGGALPAGTKWTGAASDGRERTGAAGPYGGRSATTGSNGSASIVTPFPVTVVAFSSE